MGACLANVGVGALVSLGLEKGSVTLVTSEGGALVAACAPGVPNIATHHPVAMEVAVLKG